MRKIRSRFIVAGVLGATAVVGVAWAPTGGAQEPPVEEPCIITGATGPLSTPIYNLGTGLGILSGPVKGLGCAFDTLGF
jgi:hypothetical protein